MSIKTIPLVIFLQSQKTKKNIIKTYTLSEYKRIRNRYIFQQLLQD